MTAQEKIDARMATRKADIAQLQEQIEARRALVERESANLQTDMLNLHRHQAALAQLRELRADLDADALAAAAVADSAPVTGVEP